MHSSCTLLAKLVCSLMRCWMEVCTESRCRIRNRRLKRQLKRAMKHEALLSSIHGRLSDCVVRQQYCLFPYRQDSRVSRVDVATNARDGLYGLCFIGVSLLATFCFSMVIVYLVFTLLSLLLLIDWQLLVSVCSRSIYPPCPPGVLLTPSQRVRLAIL